VKISNKFFSFFSSRNQYFPHIPYVASKKCFPMKIAAKKVQGKFSAEEFFAEYSSFFEAINSSPKHSSQVFVDEISSSKSDSRKKNVCLVELFAEFYFF
jgi:hypothetical protein